MRINQNLEELLLKCPRNVALFEDSTLNKKYYSQTWGNYTLVTNMHFIKLQDNTLLSAILHSCADLGFNINSSLLFTTLTKRVDPYSKILTIGHLESFLNFYIYDLILEIDQDLIYLSQSKAHLQHN
ncbi:MAG: hypothetical protein KC646_13690 [Candidatus Cloacimonetes bacterium]|nr:hypothetical protein [Candidatus Cloacimonadota bacterium]